MHHPTTCFQETDQHALLWCTGTLSLLDASSRLKPGG